MWPIYDDHSKYRASARLARNQRKSKKLGVTMKRYTDKQLKAMTPEELEEVREQALEEYQKVGQQLEELLAKNPLPTAKTDNK